MCFSDVHTKIYLTQKTLCTNTLLSTLDTKNILSLDNMFSRRNTQKVSIFQIKCDAKTKLAIKIHNILFFRQSFSFHTVACAILRESAILTPVSLVTASGTLLIMSNTSPVSLLAPTSPLPPDTMTTRLH